MKWSRLAYCAALAAVTTLLVVLGTSQWFTVPLGALAAWWTFVCTRALWVVASFQVELWRYQQSPSLPTSIDVPRKAKQLDGSPTRSWTVWSMRERWSLYCASQHCCGFP